jgi:hypothetical protein
MENVSYKVHTTKCDKIVRAIFDNEQIVRTGGRRWRIEGNRQVAQPTKRQIQK